MKFKRFVCMMMALIIVLVSPSKINATQWNPSDQNGEEWFYLNVGEAENALYLYQPSTEQIKKVRKLDRRFSDIAMDKNGQLWGVSSILVSTGFRNDLYKINGGSSTFIKSLSITSGDNVRSLTVGTDGLFYFMDVKTLKAYDALENEVLILHEFDSVDFGYISDLAFLEGRLYLSESGNATNPISLYEMDMDTYALEKKLSTSSTSFALSVANGRLYITEGTAIKEIDPDTWTFTKTFDSTMIVPPSFAGATDGFYSAYDPTIAMVDISPKGGVYNTNQLVTISSEAWGKIYYTLDGSIPTEHSALYTQPVTVTENTILSAISVGLLGEVSAVKTETFEMDFIAPIAPEIQLSPIEPTRGPVQATVLAPGISEEEKLWVKVNGGDWIEELSGVIFEGLMNGDTVDAKVVDAAGNVSSTNTVVFTDNLPPDILVISVPEVINSETKNNMKIVVTTSQDAQDVTVSVSNKELTVNAIAIRKSDDLWEATVDVSGLSDGQLSTYVSVKDALGNTRDLESSAYSMKDTQIEVPLVSVQSTADGSVKTITMETAIVEDSIEYSLDDQEWQVYGGEITITEDITLQARTKDLAGNVSEVVSQNIDVIEKEIGGGGDTGSGDTGSGDTGGSDDETDIPDDTIPLGSIAFSEPYILGYPNGTFQPAKAITRIEMAAIFARILKLNLKGTSTTQYSDIQSTHWGYVYLQAVSEIGLFNGYKDGSFKPNQAMTRAELTSVISRYWDHIGYVVNAENSDLTDISGNWAQESINKLYNEHLILGFPDKTFKPNQSLKREEVVVVINNLIDRPQYDNATGRFLDLPKSHWSFKYIEAASHYYKDNLFSESLDNN